MYVIIIYAGKTRGDFMEKLSEQELVRREKLENLKSNNIDPFGTRFDRNNSTKSLIISNSFLKLFCVFL